MHILLFSSVHFNFLNIYICFIIHVYSLLEITTKLHSNMEGGYRLLWSLMAVSLINSVFSIRFHRLSAILSWFMSIIKPFIVVITVPFEFSHSTKESPFNAFIVKYHMSTCPHASFLFKYAWSSCWFQYFFYFCNADSTVLAYVLSELNRHHNYGLDLFLLSVDEGITGYRDDSLETVKRNEIQVRRSQKHSLSFLEPLTVNILLCSI